MTTGDESVCSRALSFGPFHLTPATRLLTKDGVSVSIGSRGLDILLVLLGKAGEIVDKQDILDRVWPNTEVQESNFRVHLTTLRRVLGDGVDGARYIVNISGRGYAFVAPVRYSDGAASRSSHTRLPAGPQRLVGRADLIAELSEQVPTTPLISLIGPPGIGKTSVATAIAHVQRPHFGDDATHFIDLSAVTDPGDVPGVIAAALGVTGVGIGRVLDVALLLSGRRLLFVLDNCEHLIEQVATLAARIIREAAGVRLLATSREALRIEGERVCLLEPLGVPRTSTPTADEALAAPAVQLFMDRAAAAGYLSELSDHDALIVAAICSRLDGVALAISLVAGWVSIHGIHGIAELIERGNELSIPGQRSGPSRHRTLEAMLEWSYALLDRDEQRVFRRLGSFVGAFTLDAAETIAGDRPGESAVIRQAISSLCGKSLLSVSVLGNKPHYRMLETTRVYAATRLADSGEGEKIAARHASYFAQPSAFPSDSRARSIDEAQLDVCAQQITNVRAALTWTFAEPSRSTTGILLAARAAPLLVRLSLLNECHRWCRRALTALPEEDKGTATELALQEGLAVASTFAFGNGAETKAALDRSVELAERIGDVNQQLNLLTGLHLFLTRRGDYTAALVAAKRCEALATQSGDVVEKVMAEWMLGSTFHYTGDQAAALHHARLGFKLEAPLHPIRSQRFGLNNRVRALVLLARASFLTGFPDQAYALACQAMQAADDRHQPLTHCIGLIFSVPVLLWRGDFDEAAEPIETVLAIANRYSLAPYRAFALAMKGSLLVAAGDLGLGVSLLRKGLEEMHAEQQHIGISAASGALAEAMLRSGHPEAALAAINAAIECASQQGEILWLPELLRTQGEIMLEQTHPDLASAEAVLLRAIELARRQSALSWELKPAIALARLLMRIGQEQRAKAVLLQHYARFTEGFETRDLRAARQVLDELGSVGRSAD